jgi:hypothetical protein
MTPTYIVHSEVSGPSYEPIYVALNSGKYTGVQCIEKFVKTSYLKIMAYFYLIYHE